MTSFYWYEKHPELLEAEKEAMHKFFPGFQLRMMDDDKLCWIGTLNPRGKDGGVWKLMVVYDHSHPHNNVFGGSIKVYSIKPNLNKLYSEAGRLPHVLRDSKGNLYMCTARSTDVDSGVYTATSAAKALGWAAKWIWATEGWLHGEIGDEVFLHTF